MEGQGSSNNHIPRDLYIGGPNGVRILVRENSCQADTWDLIAPNPNRSRMVEGGSGLNQFQDGPCGDGPSGHFVSAGFTSSVSGIDLNVCPETDSSDMEMANKGEGNSGDALFVEEHVDVETLLDGVQSSNNKRKAPEVELDVMSSGGRFPTRRFFLGESSSSAAQRARTSENIRDNAKHPPEMPPPLVPGMEAAPPAPQFHRPPTVAGSEHVAGMPVQDERPTPTFIEWLARNGMQIDPVTAELQQIQMTRVIQSETYAPQPYTHNEHPSSLVRIALEEVQSYTAAHDGNGMLASRSSILYQSGGNRAYFTDNIDSHLWGRSGWSFGESSTSGLQNGRPFGPPPFMPHEMGVRVWDAVDHIDTLTQGYRNVLIGASARNAQPPPMGGGDPNHFMLGMHNALIGASVRNAQPPLRLGSPSMSGRDPNHFMLPTYHNALIGASVRNAQPSLRLGSPPMSDRNPIDGDPNHFMLEMHNALIGASARNAQLPLRLGSPPMGGGHDGGHTGRGPPSPSPDEWRRYMLLSENNDAFPAVNGEPPFQFMGPAMRANQDPYYEADNEEEEEDELDDMRLDVDDMTYEELVELQERIGTVGTGLSEETIMKHLKRGKYKSAASNSHGKEHEPCCICLEDYAEDEDFALLDCWHDFHFDCIRKWLKYKNVCPVCKSAAIHK